jgi:hypothetical protein
MESTQDQLGEIRRMLGAMTEQMERRMDIMEQRMENHLHGNTLTPGDATPRTLGSKTSEEKLQQPEAKTGGHTGQIISIPKLRGPKEFSGDEKPWSSAMTAAWFRQFEEYMRTTGVPLQSYPVFFGQSLSGSANQWWYYHISEQERQLSWERIKEMVEKRFAPPNELLNNMGKLRRLKQMGGAQAYSNKFNELWQSVRERIDEATALMFYLDGLDDRIRPSIVARQPQNLREAQEDAARTWAASYTAGRGKPRSSQETGQNQNKNNSQKSSNEGGSQKTNTKGGDKNEKDPSKRGSFKCYTCNMEGHKASECPDKGKEKTQEK